MISSPHIANYGLESRTASAGRPATVITAEDVAAGKPQPNSYLLGARRLGRAPEEVRRDRRRAGGHRRSALRQTPPSSESDPPQTSSTSRSPLPTCAVSDTTAPDSPLLGSPAEARRAVAIARGPEVITAQVPVGLVVSSRPGDGGHLGGMREFRADEFGCSLFDGLWFDESATTSAIRRQCSMSR